MISLNQSNNAFSGSFYPATPTQNNTNPGLIELPKFIASLLQLPPNHIKSQEDFNHHIQYISSSSIEFPPTTIHYINNIIQNQFPDMDCIREIVSNALDGHARAKRFDKPVHLNFNGNQLILEDEGDGMDWSSLIPFFVPGRSSNSKAIFDLKEGLPQVTGRFGQGALAIYSLLYAQPTNQSRMISSGLDKRKISIHTKREGKEGLKIKIIAIGEKVFLKEITEKPKEKTGTIFKITAPVIGENTEKLISHITKTFKHVSIPFFINQALINSSSHKTLSVEGGALYYMPQGENSNEGGALCICEGGKLIKEFTIEKGLVPEEITVNFDQLPLTHDRSTLDFKDSNSIAILEALIDKIWTSDISLLEKGALMNGLFPITGKKQYNLIKKIRETIAHSDLPFLPDSADFRALNENTGLYLNSNYFTSLPYPIFFEDDGYKLYIHPTSSAKPVAAISCDGQYHIFLNAQLFTPNNFRQLQYNLSLLNLWLHNKNEKITVDINKILLHMQGPKSRVVQKLYRTRVGLTNLDSARQNKIEASFACGPTEEDHSPIGKADEEDQFWKVAASPNSSNLPACGISMEPIFNQDKHLSTCESLDRHKFDPFSNEQMSDFILNQEILDKYLIFQKSMDIAGIDRLKILVPKNDGASTKFLQDCFEAYSSTEFSQLQKILTFLPQFLQLKLLRAFIREEISYLTWLSSLPEESLKSFFSVFPWNEVKQMDGSKNDNFNENDYQHILLISKKDHLPLHAKQLFVKLYTWAVRLRCDVAYAAINTQNFFQFLLTIIDGEIWIDLKEIEELDKEMRSFFKNAEEASFKIHYILKDLSTSLKLQPDLPIEGAIAVLEQNNRQPLKNFSLKESLQISYEIHTSTNQNKIDYLKQMFRHIWEKSEFISSSIRPYIYAMLSQEGKNFISETFTFPIQFDPARNIYLHDDEAVHALLYTKNNKENIKNIPCTSKKEKSEYARSRIQSALKQNVTENFCVGELVKNADEAGATEINFEFHTTDDGKSVLIVEDDGSGMTKEDLDFLKTTNATLKGKSNYGWAFFTVFNDFDEVVVSTSKDGQATHHLYLKNTEKGILTQEMTTDEPRAIGTTFMMIKGEGSNPLIDFIKLKAEIVSKCQFMKNMDICLQKLSLTGNQKPAIYHEERDGEMLLQLGNGDEGIYCKKIRASDIPESCTSFLPDPLKKMLVEKQIKLRLFLPHNNQNMNRNLIKEEGFTEKAGLLIFSALFHFYLKQFLPGAEKENDDLLKILSDDYWAKFDHRFHLYQQLPLMIEAIKEKKWDLLTIEPNHEMQQNFFGFPNPFISNVSTKILKKNDLKRKKEALEKLKTILSDPSLFAQLLTNTPLSSMDPSSTFMAIRNEWIYVLVNENFLLLKDKEYNIEFIKNNTPEELKIRLDQCKQIVSILVNERDSTYSKKIINMFAQSILEHCIAIKEQSVEIIIQEGELPPEAKNLTLLCKKIAERFDRKIKVKYYSKADGSNAFVNIGVDTIFANRLGLLKNFLKIYTHTNPIDQTGMLNEQQMESIIEVIRTIIHELVHLNEDSECQTHDAVFRNQLANFLEKLFIQNDEPEKSVLNMLGF